MSEAVIPVDGESQPRLTTHCVATIDGLTIPVSGSIDTTTLGTSRRDLDDEIEGHAGDVVVDLHELGSCRGRGRSTMDRGNDTAARRVTT